MRSRATVNAITLENKAFPFDMLRLLGITTAKETRRRNRMTVTVGINGFGRIGRCTLAHIAEAARNDVQVVKINATGPLETSAHLLRYDSVHGRFPGEVKVANGTMDLGRGPMEMFSTYDPSELDWSGCDVVLECTGQFNDGNKAGVHLERGAKSVLISAPAKNVQKTVVYGVNHRDLIPGDTMISNGSCTPNCLAPLAKVVNDKWGIKRGLMTTVHAATATQKTVDGPSAKDWRGGRGILENIIPSSTGAAKAVGVVIPELNKKLTGMSFRVPTSDVSVVDLTVELDKDASYEEICAEMKAQADGALKGILGYTEDAVVATDFRGDARTSIFDAKAGIQLDGTFVKLVSWYDNEWGYSNKCLEMGKGGA